ncbi:hypothetical protein AB0B66_26795 [Catellatospora sp. NPDC049111]
MAESSEYGYPSTVGRNTGRWHAVEIWYAARRPLPALAGRR